MLGTAIVISSTTLIANVVDCWECGTDFQECRNDLLEKLHETKKMMGLVIYARLIDALPRL